MAFNEEDWSADQRAIRENIGDHEFDDTHRERLIHALGEAVLQQRHLKDQAYAHSREMWSQLRDYSKQIDGSEEGDFGCKVKALTDLRTALTGEVEALRNALDVYCRHDDACAFAHPAKEGVERCCSCGFSELIAGLAKLDSESLSAQQRLLPCTCASEEADFPWHDAGCPAGGVSSS